MNFDDDNKHGIRGGTTLKAARMKCHQTAPCRPIPPSHVKRKRPSFRALVGKGPSISVSPIVTRSNKKAVAVKTKFHDEAPLEFRHRPVKGFYAEEYSNTRDKTACIKEQGALSPVKDGPETRKRLNRLFPANKKFDLDTYTKLYMEEKVKSIDSKIWTAFRGFDKVNRKKTLVKLSIVLDPQALKNSQARENASNERFAHYKNLYENMVHAERMKKCRT